ncbi:MAG: hypothetical protein WA817_24355 [Candidatus Acidiferrum sp.]
MDAKHFARIRRFLYLTQFDVAVATGVPLGRVGAGERGVVFLNHCETKSISNFLESRLRMTLKADDERSDIEIAASDGEAFLLEAGRRAGPAQVEFPDTPRAGQ